jgi:hypothetical protein
MQRSGALDDGHPAEVSSEAKGDARQPAGELGAAKVVVVQHLAAMRPRHF